MKKLVVKELTKEATNLSFKILEIGSWAGDSTTFLASMCKEYQKGKVYCIDWWLSSPEAPKKMQAATKNNKIFKLFLHNIEAAGVKDRIVILKGTSDTMAEILKSECFDLIYLDGDHVYKQFKRDLENYTKMLKINGIICGDDLDLVYEQVDSTYLKDNLEKDCIYDSKFKIDYHPGITLGLYEMFGKVSVKHGFWAMRKIKKGWECVDL